MSGYSKAYGYNLGDKITKTDHEWNLIEVQGKWYFMETTWGSGHAGKKEGENSKSKDQFIK